MAVGGLLKHIYKKCSRPQLLIFLLVVTTLAGVLASLLYPSQQQQQQQQLPGNNKRVSVAGSVAPGNCIAEKKRRLREGNTKAREKFMKPVSIRTSKYQLITGSLNFLNTFSLLGWYSISCNASIWRASCSGYSGSV